MSVAAIFVLTITIMLVTGLFFFHGVSNFLILQIQNKIDITAYFKSDAQEQDIFTVRDSLKSKFPSIKDIEYVSKDHALNSFTQKNQDSTVFSKALSEVGDNPFLPSLNIMTDGNVQQYQQIANLLNQDRL